MTFHFVVFINLNVALRKHFFTVCLLPPKLSIFWFSRNVHIFSINIILQNFQYFWRQNIRCFVIAQCAPPKISLELAKAILVFRHSLCYASILLTAITCYLLYFNVISIVLIHIKINHVGICHCNQLIPSCLLALEFTTVF